jgi:tryptophanyl-tRNA synthetase
VISVRDGAVVDRQARDIAATWVAFGLDPDRSALYRQSDVPEVCELTWLLGCVTPKGLLNRAHAYKAALDANRSARRTPDDGVTAGLYGYPLLMAADILGPRAGVVPVGLDQRQHVEIARDIAESFNGAYGPVLVLPEARIDPAVETIPGLDGRKMSKSYGNVIPLLAEPGDLRRAVMRIVTDSRPPSEPKDPAADPIFSIYRHVAPPAEVAAMADGYRLGGLGYGDAKKRLAEALEALVSEPRRRHRELLADPAELDRILASGAARVRERVTATIASVREATLGRRSTSS